MPCHSICPDIRSCFGGFWGLCLGPGGGGGRREAGSVGVMGGVWGGAGCGVCVVHWGVGGQSGEKFACCVRVGVTAWSDPVPAAWGCFEDIGARYEEGWLGGGRMPIYSASKGKVCRKYDFSPFSYVFMVGGGWVGGGAWGLCSVFAL